MAAGYRLASSAVAPVLRSANGSVEAARSNRTAPTRRTRTARASLQSIRRRASRFDSDTANFYFRMMDADYNDKNVAPETGWLPEVIGGTPAQPGFRCSGSDGRGSRDPAPDGRRVGSRRSR